VGLNILQVGAETIGLDSSRHIERNRKAINERFINNTVQVKGSRARLWTSHTISERASSNSGRASS